VKPAPKKRAFAQLEKLLSTVDIVPDVEHDSLASTLVPQKPKATPQEFSIEGRFTKAALFPSLRTRVATPP